jgi:Flp pilus assembly protein TadB
MRDMTQWLQRHLWVYALVLLVTDAGVLLLIRPSRSPLGAVLSAALYVGIFMAIRQRGVRKDRRAAGDDKADVVGLGRMLLKGRVPQEPGERDEMRGLLRRRNRQLRWLRWYIPAFSVVMYAFAVLALCTGGVGSGLTVLVSMAALDVIFVRNFRRQRRNVRRMENGLDRREGPGRPEGLGRQEGLGAH